MKIYQLHKYGGEWEESFDYIIGSYLRKERAEEAKIKAEAEEEVLIEQGKKCNRCIFLERNFAKVEELLAKFPNYCSRAKLISDECGIDCENYCLHWGDSKFQIEEVEVEE